MFEAIEKVLNADYDHEQPDIPRSKAFHRECSKFIKKAIAPYGLELIRSKSATYCASSGFITDGKGKFVYYSIGDYRWEDWKHGVLIRTAKNEKDYTGGMNHYCELKDIGETVYNLFA